MSTLISNKIFAIDARLNHALFSDPTTGTYIETHLTINSRSITFIKDKISGKYHGKVGVLLVFERNNAIIKADKYLLSSPFVDSLNKVDFYFTDLQRYPLDTGSYTLKIKLLDAYDSTNTANANTSFAIKTHAKVPWFSDAFFVENIASSTNSKLTRSGFDLKPYVSSMYLEGNDTLRYYLEFYNTQKMGLDSTYLLNTFVSLENNTLPIGGFTKYKKMNSKNGTWPIFDAFLINTLTAGNYQINFEIKDRNNKILHQKTVPFQRTLLAKPITNYEEKLKTAEFENSFVMYFKGDQILDQVKSVRPIATDFERSHLDRIAKYSKTDTTLQRRFLLTFWEDRNKTNPRDEWEKYNLEVVKVNQNFSTKQYRGYETERGRVYLKYGAPNSRNQSTHEANAYPYEIWWYYNLKNQRNVRFVFYNPDLVTDNFVLLHSEAFGEPSNPQWRFEIMKRSTPTGGSLDHQDLMRFKGWGNNMDDIFRNQ